MLEYARTWLELRFDKRGVTAMEYGLIAALISIALVAVMGTFTGGLTDVFTRIGLSLR